MTEPIDAKAVLLLPSRIKCSCGHIAAEHGACCFECPCEASMHEVMKVGYRDALAETQQRLEALTASAETWRADIEEASSKPGDLLTLAREMALALEVREESIADWRSHSEETQRQLDTLLREAYESEDGPGGVITFEVYKASRLAALSAVTPAPGQ